MGYKTFVSLNIAVIGEGRKVISLAKRLANVGHNISIGWKDGGAKDQKIMGSRLGDCISFAHITDAAAEADVIIISAAASHVREIAYLLDDVRRKVIVDSTFILPEAFEENINTINAITAITGSPFVVKSFNCSGYQNLIDPLFKGQSVDSFVAGNSIKAKAVVKILARDLGYSNCYDFGNDTTIPLLEEMAKCWHNLSQRANMTKKVAGVVVKK
ncbi:MAG: NAD(P)-binding domain-containing protein [Flavipsychrobacter sp.]|nr:NAD(P)-binding domain-containing protein [Flavipsychrobacter sp.]